MTGPEHDISFDAMGSHVRLLIGEPGPGMAPAAVAAEQARRFVVDFERHFRASSRTASCARSTTTDGSEFQPPSCCAPRSGPA